MIPISVVDLGDTVEAAVLEVLRSGIIAQGPMVKRLEDEFAEMIGVKHVVAVNNGTTALIAALAVSGLEPGDEVITSPFTFVATLNAILQAGATARFADIDPLDFNVRPDAVEALIGPRTRAILPVHLYGQAADMGALVPMVDEHGLRLIEDAAQAHGATIDGRCVGTFGIGCFSLYATKNLTSAEGGLISTNDDDIADRLRVLRNQGMRQRYEYEMAGNNYRLTDLQAAVCVPQLALYGDRVEARRRNAAALNEALSGLDWLTTPTEVDGRGHVWHQYTVLVDEAAPMTRDALVEHLTARGVGCGIYYPKVVNDYDCYRADERVVYDNVPVATDIARRCLSLPVHQRLTSAEIDVIVDAVRTAGRG